MRVCCIDPRTERKYMYCMPFCTAFVSFSRLLTITGDPLVAQNIDERLCVKGYGAIDSFAMYNAPFGIVRHPLR